MSIGVPSAIKTFNWIGTLWGGKIQFTVSMLFAMGLYRFLFPAGFRGFFWRSLHWTTCYMRRITWLLIFIW